MAKDFRANQIRTAQIIASGTDWAAKGGGQAAGVRLKPKLGMLMYSSSYAQAASGSVNNAYGEDVRDYDGGFFDAKAFLNEFGDEPWLVISGNSSATQQINQPHEDGGSVLFMGDVIISGTLFGKRQVIVVDKDVPGDLWVQNNFHLSGNMFGGTTTWGAADQSGAVIYPEAITYFRGNNTDTPPMIAFGAIDQGDKKGIAGGIYPTALGGSPADNGSRGGAEYFFWVSGSKDSLMKGRGGAACFGGDLLISGNIIVSGSNNIHDMSKDQILNNSSSFAPKFGHDATHGGGITRYDRWYVDPGSGTPGTAPRGGRYDFDSVIATGDGTQLLSLMKTAHLVLSAGYGRLVVSGSGEVAIGRMGEGAGGDDGGILRFGTTGSNAAFGPALHFSSQETPYGILKYTNRPFNADTFNGPHHFVGGTVTGSNGFMVTVASNVTPNLKGQAIGYMFQGMGATNAPGTSGLYQNLHEVSRSSPILGGPLNSLVLTGANNTCSVKIGAGSALNLAGRTGVNIDAGHGVSADNASPVIIKATGTATLSGSDGVNIQSDTGEIDITSGGAFDVNAQSAVTIDSTASSINLTSKTAIQAIAADNSGAATVVRLTATNGGGGTAIVDINADNEIQIDVEAGGQIKIGTEESGVPVHIGHTTSEVIIGDNATVHGNLHVLGDFIKGHVISASMGDPLLLLNSGSVVPNSGGGIAIASGSKVVLPTPHPAAGGSATFNPSMVFGRDTTTGRDTFLAGRLNTHNGSVISLATATPIDIRASGYRTVSGMTLTASRVGSVPHVTMSNQWHQGSITIGYNVHPVETGPLILSASQFSFERGKKLYFDEPNGQYMQCGDGAPNQLIMKLGAAGLRFTGIPKLEFQGAGVSIEGGRHVGVRSQTLYLSASTLSGNPGNIVLSGSHNIIATGSSYSFKLGQDEKLYFDETTANGGPYFVQLDKTNDRLHIVTNTSGQIQLAYTVYVDGDPNNPKVGIGVADPGYALDVKNHTSAAGVVQRLKQTADTPAGAQIRLENTRNGQQGSDDDYCGGIQFWSTDDASNETMYGKILAQVKDASDGSEAGRVRIQLRDSSLGTPTTVDAMDIMLDQVLILSGGHATDTDESSYTDLAFFVSGSINNANHQTVKGTSLFGGDVVVSGALQVKNALTASGLATGHLTLTDAAATLGFFNASNNFIKRDSNNLTFRDVALGQTKTLTQLASLSVVDNSDVFSVTHGAPSYVVTTGSFSFDTNERATNATPAAGGPGADTYFFVSGSRGCRGTTDRGLVLFAGDLHVSGTVTSDDSVFGGSLDDAYDTPQGGGTKVAGIGGTINVATHAPITLKQEGADTSTISPLLQVSGGIKIGQLRIAPNVDDAGHYTRALIFNTASNGQIIFGAGSTTKEAFRINQNANTGIERDSGTGVGRKLFFRPSENTTFLQYTNTEAGSPGPRVLHMKNLTTDGRISLAMGASGAANGSGYEGILAVSGSIEPGFDNLYNLGSPAKRFANLYTGDLHLRNDRGNWTIYEEPDMLVVVNNLTGKKYKMGLTPLEDDE